MTREGAAKALSIGLIAAVFWTAPSGAQTDPKKPEKPGASSNAEDSFSEGIQHIGEGAKRIGEGIKGAAVNAWEAVRAGASAAAQKFQNEPGPAKK